MFSSIKIYIDKQFNQLFQNACNILKITKLSNQLNKKQLQTYTPQVLYEKQLKNMMKYTEQSFKYYSQIKIASIDILHICNIKEKGIAITIPDLIQNLKYAINMVKENAASTNQLEFFRNSLKYIQQANKEKWTKYQKDLRSSLLQEKDRNLLKQMAAIKFSSQSNDYRRLYQQQLSSTKKMIQLFDNIRFQGISLNNKKMIEQIPNKIISENVVLLINYLQNYCIFYNREGSPFSKLITVLSDATLSDDKINITFKQLPKAQQKLMEPLVKLVANLKSQNAKLRTNESRQLPQARTTSLTERQKRYQQTISQLQNNLGIKKEENHFLQLQNKRLKSQVQQSNSKVQQLTLKIKSAQNQIKKYSDAYNNNVNLAKIKLKTQLQSKSTANQQKLIKQLAQLKVDHDDTVRQYNDIIRQYDQICNQKSQLQIKIQAIKTQNEERLVKIQKELDSISKQFQKQRKRYEEFNTQRLNMQASSKNKHQISIIIEQLSKEREQQHQIIESYKQLQQSLQSSYQEKLNKLRINQKCLRKNISQLQSLHKALQEENKKQANQLKEVKQQLKSKNQQQNQFIILQEKYVLLHEQYQSLIGKDNDSLKTEPSQNQFNKQPSGHQNEVYQLRQELNKRNTKINSILEANQRTLAIKDQKITSLERRIIDLNQKVTSLQKKISLLSEEERIQ